MGGELARYQILTWDSDAETFTTQDGVPEYVEGLSGLRSAIRLLREMGYTAHRAPLNSDCGDSDPSVSIERVD